MAINITPIQNSNNITEYLPLVLGALQLLWVAVSYLIKHIINTMKEDHNQLKEDVKTLYDFHNNRQAECSKHGERIAKLEAKVEK